jgi:monoamine oxidase
MTVEADRTVLTVPARLMDRIHFDPPLPEWKRRALAAVDYGHAAKLFVPLRAPAAPSGVLSVPDRFWCWTAKGERGGIQPVVSCFAGSAPALAALGDADGPARWLERLAVLRPDLALDPGGALLVNWDDDPWIGGSYATVLTGNPRDIDVLVEPAGPLHFAGEHTDPLLWATMEGALRSGQRAAAELSDE